MFLIRTVVTLIIMSDLELFTEITSLPSNLKEEVADFIAFLKHKTKTSNAIKERTYGYAKGFFKMSDDFDEPLEAFEEYS